MSDVATGYFDGGCSIVASLAPNCNHLREYSPQRRTARQALQGFCASTATAGDIDNPVEQAGGQNTTAAARLSKRSMIRARPSTEVTIRNQIGQPASSIMCSKIVSPP